MLLFSRRFRGNGSLVFYSFQEAGQHTRTLQAVSGALSGTRPTGGPVEEWQHGTTGTTCNMVPISHSI